jgi:nucleoside-diphosphate-sugar epimerase
VISDWEGPHYGELNPKEWSDLDNIDQITSLPDSAPHRKIEKYLQGVAVEHGDKLKCAIISSCGVYGPGKGMGNTQSILIPMFYDEIVKLGRAFYTGSGGNQRSWVHMDDLMQVYLKLVESAAVGGGDAVWGKEVRVCDNSNPKETIGKVETSDAVLVTLRLRDTTSQPPSKRPSWRWQSRPAGS